MSRSVVLGASGFLGSHLCDALLREGHQVIGVDDYSSSSGRNLSHLSENNNFQFVNHNIVNEINIAGEVDFVLNFASLASPPRYLEQPLHTLRTGSIGTENAILFATSKNARFIMASTSEVYGEPLVHPQTESYWGNVNPIGERSCYDEAKRYAEALCFAHIRSMSANIGIVRIFNTYGPRLDPQDGRVVSNFVYQALKNLPLTIQGDGLQTRSFCYVDDLIKGIVLMMKSTENGPVNFGNPYEFSVRQLAEMILKLTHSSSELVSIPRASDDPTQRCPDIALARALFDWKPEIQLEEGLQKTISWFRDNI